MSAKSTCFSAHQLTRESFLGWSFYGIIYQKQQLLPYVLYVRTRLRDNLPLRNTQSEHNIYFIFQAAFWNTLCCMASTIILALTDYSIIDFTQRHPLHQNIETGRGYYYSYRGIYNINLVRHRGTAHNHSRSGQNMHIPVHYNFS